jgi:hypothetical protein
MWSGLDQGRDLGPEPDRAGQWTRVDQTEPDRTDTDPDQTGPRPRPPRAPTPTPSESSSG